ncbi:MAG: hypothetical protein HZA93_10985 [Verrucomicrobia bacterium]|nr:hypothetical protein [Verrucomicrobiota bacterium]
MNAVIRRPESLREVAERADSIEAWGLALGDFLDEIRYRRQHDLPIADCWRIAPSLLREKFPQGDVADAFAAALAERLAVENSNDAPPAWTQAQDRFLTTPWFADDSPKVREYLHSATPGEFRKHGVFIDTISLSRA